MKSLADWFRGRGADDTQRHAIDSEASGEFRGHLLELVTQQTERVNQLECRLDEHDQRCDDKIRDAIQKSEAECEDKIERELADLENRLRDRLDEASEPMEVML